MMSLTLPSPFVDVVSGAVEPTRTSARKATVDDLPALHALWQSAGLPWNELERFVTEFLVVPTDDGLVAGAIGLQLDGSEGLVHSEAIASGADADEIRAALWARLQIVARNLGATRLWTLEDAPFWAGVFTRADRAAIDGLKASFRDPEAAWMLYQLLDPSRAQKMLDERLALWEATRQSESENLLETIQRVRTIAFGIAGVLIGGMLLMILYIFIKRPDILHRFIGK